MMFIGLLSLMGFLISLYFVLVYHALLEPDSRLIPSFCRMEKGSCLSIIRTRDARILGIPNFHLGILYYLVLNVLSFFPDVVNQNPGVVRIVSGGTVVVGVYLTYSLLFRIKKHCVLCYASHSINLLLFILLWIFP